MQIPVDYLFAGILMLISLVLPLTMIAIPQVVSKVFRLTQTSRVTTQPYECGITPTGAARARFSIKFYVVAMLFILFDIEAVFLYPWAAVHRWLGWFGLIEMGIFVFFLAAGYIYVWRRGALEWE